MNLQPTIALIIKLLPLGMLIVNAAIYRRIWNINGDWSILSDSIIKPKYNSLIWFNATILYIWNLIDTQTYQTTSPLNTALALQTIMLARQYLYLSNVLKTLHGQTPEPTIGESGSGAGNH